MSISTTIVSDPVAVIIRRSPYDLEYCHVDDGSGTTTMCGIADEDYTCGEYDGEAICPTCGLPCCPRCAVLCDIEERLE